MSSSSILILEFHSFSLKTDFKAVVVAALNRSISRLETALRVIGIMIINMITEVYYHMKNRYRYNSVLKFQLFG
jgi:hypothetical protein